MDIDALYKIVGRKISERRKSDDIALSQDYVANELKMSRASIVNIEAGRQHPPLHVIWKISDVLKTEVSELIPTKEEYSIFITPNDPMDKIRKELLNHPESQEIIMSLYKEIKSQNDTDK